MKKWLSLILMLLLCLLCCGALADGFDLAALEAEGNYTITPAEGADYLFIDCDEQLTVGDRSFTHAYEHEKRYSYVYTDMIVYDYETEPQPVLRTWIEYRGTKRLDIDSVTFTFGGKSYTFTGVGREEDLEEDEDGCSETLLIIHGNDNLDFLADLTVFIVEELASKQINEVYVPFVLHGTEDVTCELSAGSLTDFEHIAVGYIHAGGLEMHDRPNASALTVAEQI